jgi:cytochrome b6-f complex iron-sulfur subunit
MSLPVALPPSSTLPLPIDTSCRGCSRRGVLQGIAVTAATVLAGCLGDSDPGPDDTTGPATTMCGANLCLDLNDPRNAALTTVNGSMKVDAPSDKILLMRTSTAMVQAVSDICTHAGCDVEYDQAAKALECPCHGSRFSLTGAVLLGPASRPLQTYVTQLDAATNVLTILL